MNRRKFVSLSESNHEEDVGSNEGDAEFDIEPNQSKNLLEKMNKKFYRVNTIKTS